MLLWYVELLGSSVAWLSHGWCTAQESNRWETILNCVLLPILWIPSTIYVSSVQCQFSLFRDVCCPLFCLDLFFVDFFFCLKHFDVVFMFVLWNYSCCWPAKPNLSWIKYWQLYVPITRHSFNKAHKSPLFLPSYRCTYGITLHCAMWKLGRGFVFPRGNVFLFFLFPSIIGHLWTTATKLCSFDNIGTFDYVKWRVQRYKINIYLCQMCWCQVFVTVHKYHSEMQ